MSGPLITWAAAPRVIATRRAPPGGLNVTSPCTNSGQVPDGSGIPDGPPASDPGREPPSLGGIGAPPLPPADQPAFPPPVQGLPASAPLRTPAPPPFPPLPPLPTQ